MHIALITYVAWYEYVMAHLHCIALHFICMGTSRKMGECAWLLSFTILGERVVDPIHWTTSNRAPQSLWL